MKYGLLLLLGVLWSMRFAAIKSAGQSGIPPHVVAPVSILGIAIIYSATSAVDHAQSERGGPRIARHSYLETGIGHPAALINEGSLPPCGAAMTRPLP
ncbi:hypothetical protein [Leisingera sp. M523]|uniref:hypothetical protein n=1 Tax=Leisingera sp. M523 TaxID=2867013 RepID=UPI0021A89571|nr:hypothetical protein [Leisingera sp. M523]UWQ29038.1 hypothetical protein K3557_00045 [Leisingera sp. M523]